MYFIKDEDVLINLELVRQIIRIRSALYFYYDDGDHHMQDCHTDSNAIESLDVLMTEIDRIQSCRK